MLLREEAHRAFAAHRKVPKDSKFRWVQVCFDALGMQMRCSMQVRGIFKQLHLPQNFVALIMLLGRPWAHTHTQMRRKDDIFMTIMTTVKEQSVCTTVCLAVHYTCSSLIAHSLMVCLTSINEACTNASALTPAGCLEKASTDSKISIIKAATTFLASSPLILLN